MNRTRNIFFAVLALCLIILAISLAQHLLNAVELLPVFVACTIFGVGVVLLDFLGLLGHHAGDGGADLGSHTFAGGHDLGGHDLGAHDLGGHVAVAGHAPVAAAEVAAAGVHTAAEATGQPAAGHVAADGHAQAEPGQGARGVPAAGTAGHLPATPAHAGPVAANGPNAAPVLSLLAYLRLFVYFCLGFGPAGWIALAGGERALTSLGIAVPFGVGSLFLARAFFRLQRRDTGAVPPEVDVLREQAEVIIPLDHATMGKVRVRAGMTVSELYALAADPGAGFKSGETVRIVSVTDECVYVR